MCGSGAHRRPWRHPSGPPPGGPGVALGRDGVPAGNAGMRASDQDREVTVQALRDAYVVGRLDLDEVRVRARAAYAARTWGDLHALTADLPVGQGVAGSEVSTPAAVQAWSGEREHPALGRSAAVLAALVLLAALGCLGLAAGWQPTAVIPLTILSLSALFGAALSLPPRLGIRPAASPGAPAPAGHMLDTGRCAVSCTCAGFCIGPSRASEQGGPVGRSGQWPTTGDAD